MSYREMLDDTIDLAASLPRNSEVKSRLDYLAFNVGSRAVQATVMPLAGNSELSLRYPTSYDPSAQFLLIDKDELTGDKLSEAIAPYAKCAAFVMHPGEGTIMALGSYNPLSPVGNGLLLSHEFMHVTEDEDGICDLSHRFPAYHHIGLIERRAYGLNADTFRAVDGDKYEEYATMSLPATTRKWPMAHAKIATGNSSDNPFRPPRDTLMDEAWCESSTARLIVLLSSLVTHHETVNYPKGEYTTNMQIGKMLAVSA